MRREALLGAAGYAATAAVAAAMIAGLTSSDLGGPQGAPHITDAPMPSVSIPKVAAARQAPSDRPDLDLVDRRDVDTLPSPSPSTVTAPRPPSPSVVPSTPDTVPGASPPPDKSQPPDADTGKPRPCGLLLEPPSLCGNATGRDP
jgi:hypothetical protein